VEREAAEADPTFVRRVVSVVRASRRHPDVRIGSSVRGAIDLVRLADQLALLREAPPDGPEVGLDAALAALSGRLRVAESTERRADDIVRELWQAEFATPGDAPDDGDRPPGEDPPSSTEARKDHPGKA
jgi:MoxR-like ATPase